MATGKMPVPHRPFDPWAGAWGDERALTVGADGRATLRVGDLGADVAYRLERQE